MTIQTAGNHTVVLTQVRFGGTPWVVRVYKRILFFKKRVSSDWFLTEAQAKQFAEQLTRDLEKGDGLKNIQARRPGWVLHRPEH
jgi:hypothetical protein